MNKQEYAIYEAAVASFFEREGIQNLSSGHFNCPECKVEFEDEKCPKCSMSLDCANEPEFSWRPCDCCGCTLGGNREYASGYNPTTKKIHEFKICSDCVYYGEYGVLDDTTMMEIEDSDPNEPPGERLGR
jgi:hypothetical protein